MKHNCEDICGRNHSHSAESCPVQIQFKFPVCGHTATFKKVCGEPLSQEARCSEKIKYKDEKCGHDQYRSCHARKDACQEMVQFDIPGCGHKYPVKILCGEPLPQNLSCKQFITYKSLTCEHDQYRECSAKEECKHPCSKVRPDCGHPCANECHELCLSGSCQLCEFGQRESFKKAREDASHKIELLKQEARDSDSTNLLLPLSSEQPEYASVSEKCQVFFQQYTNFSVSIKTIKKCCKFSSIGLLEFTKKANGVLQEELYKMIPADEDYSGVTSLTKHLRQCIKGTEAPLYGYYKDAPPGDYSSSDPKNMTMIVADILVGETMKINRSEKTTYPNSFKEIKEYLRKEKIDSVLVTENGVPTRYKFFDGDQVHVKYIIQFSIIRKKPTTDIDSLFNGLEDCLTEIDLASFDLRDVSKPRCVLIQRAISLYNADCYKRTRDHLYSHCVYSQPKIKTVRIAVNHRLSRDYEDARKAFVKDGKDMKEVYAYHATKRKNVKSIIETNLDPNQTPVHGRAYGNGCYFSEQPDFTQKYDQHCMFIFKLILVKGMHTKVKPNKAGYCQQLVLKDVNLFKPMFVLYFNQNE